MELRRIRYFVTVAEELSFSRAARILHVAQPSLSKQIKLLENELEVELFDRSRRAIRLTEAGRLLLDDAHLLLRDVDSTMKRVRRAGAAQVGHLTIDFAPSVCSMVLPGVLRAFRADHPEVVLTLRESTPDRMVEALVSGVTDVAVLYFAFSSDGIDQAIDGAPVLRAPFLAALPEGHRLAGATDLRVADFAHENFVLPFGYPDTGLHDKVVSLCEGAGFTPRVVQEAWLMQTTLSLVSAGMGITFVPASVRGTQVGGVVYRPLRDCPDDHVEIDVLWRRDEVSPVVEAFRRTVRAWSSGTGPDRDRPAWRWTGAFANRGG